ncbi:MAG: hypothetical protein G01um10148_209 [Parcubacteria group bacterium Gr01-1014_8]|nr:MAG: hypothetical protein G01um10148_209 [Parcubacteria group bacterium Gr01-1014_8]
MSELRPKDVRHPDPERQPEMPDLLHNYVRIGEKVFPTFPPMYVELPRRVVDETIRVVETVSKKAGLLNTPEFMRVDLAPTKNGDMRLIEINAQIPGGVMFNAIAHAAYGEMQTFDTIGQNMEDMTTPTWVMSNENTGVQRVGEAEARIASDHMWGGKFTQVPADLENIKTAVDAGIDMNKALRFTLDAELQKLNDSHHLIREALADVVNKQGTVRAGDKSQLTDIESPILPKGQKKVIVPGETFVVPEGWVCKASVGLAGDDVYFPGQQVPVPDKEKNPGGVVYALQEFIDIATFDFKGVTYKYGLDMYLMKDKHSGKYNIFFMSRTCRDLPGEKLNISQSGGLIPAVVTIVPDRTPDKKG